MAKFAPSLQLSASEIGAVAAREARLRTATAAGKSRRWIVFTPQSAVSGDVAKPPQLDQP
ncbi:MAG: hypothetical protein H8E30_17255 [Alphaproteobacteria bacterium]|nr:hypothetical protein [Alphaproteobacteria bacterium]